MSETVLVIGLASVAAAIVGGGLNLAGIVFPPLASIRRQVLLAVFGLLLVTAAGLGDSHVRHFFVHGTPKKKVTAAPTLSSSPVPSGTVTPGLVSGRPDGPQPPKARMTTAPAGLPQPPRASAAPLPTSPASQPLYLATVPFSSSMNEYPLADGRHPYGITSGPDGNLWFTEGNPDGSSGNRIGRITPGGFVTEFAIPTAGGQPIGIASGPDNNLWFTEYVGNKVGRISPVGSDAAIQASLTEFPIPTGSSWPDKIASGPDNNLWFTEFNGNRIGRVTLDGTITEFPIPTPASQPVDISRGPDNNLWFTEFNGNGIGRLTPATGEIKEWGLPRAANGPASIVAHEGNLWFTEVLGNRIGSITTGGVVTEFAIPTPGSQPIGLTLGGDNNLWFTETASNKIGRIVPSTGAISEWGVPTTASGPKIIVAQQGNLWFTEFDGNKIGRLPG